MKRKFECINCGEQFEADDNKTVVCPHCQSDNVEIVSAKIPSWFWKVGVAVTVLIIIVSVFLFSRENNSGQQTTEKEESPISIIGEETDTLTVVPGLENPPTIEVGDLTFEGNGYSFNVKANHIPVPRTYIAVLDPFDNKRIAKSDEGIFTNVPFSNVDGAFYTIALVDAATDTIICSIEKPGFIKQSSVSTKMTISELQQKIDGRDNSLLGVGENDYLAPDYKLIFTGLPSDAVNIPTILAEVTDKLDMETWASAKVTALDYDDKNRISAITIKIELP